MPAALLATLAALVAVALAPAPAAHAGTYTVWSCRGPVGEALDASLWQPSGDGVERRDTCAQGGALVATLDDEHGFHDKVRAAGGGFAAIAPEGSAIAGYRVWRSALLGISRHPHPGLHASLLEDGVPAPGGCYAALGCDVLGDPRDPLAGANLVTRTGLSARTVAIDVGCDGPGWGRCHHHWGPAAELRLFRAAFDVTDDAAPAPGGAAGGTLLAAGPVHGTATLTVPAQDRGAGLRDAQARLDGRLVASAAAAGCAEPFTRFSPCPSSAAFALPVDTAAVPDGVHRLRVTVADAAGNAAVLVDRDVRVGNAVVQAVSPAAGPLRIRLDRRRYAAGARGAVGGRVIGPGGKAAPGASVLVERRWYGARRNAWKAAGLLTTDARGRFRTAVPRGARQLRFRVVPGRASAPVDVISRLVLRARMVPRLLRNGQSVTFAGRLRGAGPGARGTIVEVQAIVGGRWKTVARTRLRAGGRFAWRYRFHNTRLEALYSFRIRIAGGGARWPWAPVATARTRVHVLP